MIQALFMGTPEFAAVSLKALLDHSDINVSLVITQPDRKAGRGQSLTPPPVKALAQERGIEVYQPQSIKKNREEFLQTLERFGPFDIGVVVAYGQIIPEEILHYPRHGCVNVHGSLLPRWRGAAPIQRAIMAGDSETGVGLMKMEAGLDTGPVYIEKRTPIAEEDTFLTLHDKLAQFGAELLGDHLIDICSGDLLSTPQSAEGVTYANKIDKSESEVDWSLPATEISAKIRGLSPFPGAFTYLNSKRLKLLHCKTIGCETVENHTGSHAPGEVIEASDSRLIVGCGSGALSITELQLQGKKKLPLPEFLRGASITEGTTLG